MTATAASGELRSGKSSGDENFPVASHLISEKHRPAILAFYEFVRVADDIADHASLPPAEKLARLDGLEASLLGRDDAQPEGVRLREVLRQRDLSAVHAQDLLDAFRQDVTKLRYADWDDLIGYCRLSAMPVGRYVLDVHGEPRSTWTSSDAICAALQIINHIQDCAQDACGIGVEALAAPRASEPLLRCLHGLAARTGTLLAEGHPLPGMIAGTRLAMEIAAIEALAIRLVAILRTRDPLSEPVHLSKPAMLCTGASAAVGVVLRRLFTRRAPSLVAAQS
jgi:squalene synthase HpnC